MSFLRTQVAHLIFAALLLAPDCHVVRAAAPEGYYANIDGKSGGEMKQALHEIIRRDHVRNLPLHTVTVYGALVTPLRAIWKDPANPQNILLAYSSPSVPALATTWNREHLWPRSRGNTEQMGPDESDLFHVVPADAQMNSLRNNRYYDLSDLNDPGYVISLSSAPQVSYDSNSWQPAPDERGDIARAMFYMDVRYNGMEPNTTDLELVSFAPSGAQMGNLNTFLLWHAEDPPDDAERARNDLIYSNYQGNRNPFIDRPELVAAIWGSGIPGDPLSVPLARVSVAAASASESPPSPAQFVISLNQFAPAGDVLVNFSMSGAASLSEYTLSGDVVSFDPATGLGSVRVQQGYATALINLTPLADGVPENAEDAVLTLVFGAGYGTTPDASKVGAATLRDMPSLPVYWNFDNVTPTNRSISANSGVGYVSLSNWTGNIKSFGGQSNSPTGSLALDGVAGTNFSWIDFNFSTVGYRNLSLSFWTQGTPTGFTNGSWSFSVDGSGFTTLAGINTATRSSWSYRFVDFTSFSLLNNATAVTVRYTLSGASGSSGNNRIDELTFNAMRMAIGDEKREASVVASVATGLETPPTPAVFSIRLNGLAPAGGLSVAFQLAGSASVEDYTVTGSQTWDAGSRSGTVFFPENEDTMFVGIYPVADGVHEPAENVVLSLPVPSSETYLVGADSTATVGIRDLRHNDNFLDASEVGSLPASAAGDNVGATRETGEPWHFSSTGSRSVWWRWTADFTGTVSINTANSNFDTVLAVYTGASVNALTRLASDNNSGSNLTSRVIVSVTQGTTYMIAVAGNGSAVGNISLSLAQISIPVISSFTPTAAAPGASVTINGFNFTGATAVYIASAPASSFSVVSDKQIVAVVPDDATYGQVEVVSPSGSGLSSWYFTAASRPGAPKAQPDREAISALSTSLGNASAPQLFTVSAESLPGPVQIAAPAGFEVSLDGQNFAGSLEVSAPARQDSAENYTGPWATGANAGSGFGEWYVWTGKGTGGSAQAAFANPADSGVTGFGEKAFSLSASPAQSGASAYGYRSFDTPMTVGDKFSLRWAVNWDPNTSTGYNYLYLDSKFVTLLSIWQGSNPGSIYLRASGGSQIDTGIPHGTGPMTWTFTLMDATTLRVTATRRDGSSEIVFTRDIAVAGAPDSLSWYAYQLDPDIRRRLYFNDLRIDSAAPGGGRLPATTVHVRLAASAPAGNLTGQIGLSSGGQSLGSLEVSGTVTGVESPRDSYKDWLGDHPSSAETLRRYAIGAASGPLSNGEDARHAWSQNELRLTAVVREGDPKLVVHGESVEGLDGAWSTNAVTVRGRSHGVDQAGAAAGFERREYAVPRVGSAQRFLRLKVTRGE